MKLSFFTDQCVPTALREALREDGHEVELLAAHLPTNAPDPLVMAKAVELDFMLVTLNGDFADIVAYPPSKYWGIVAFQINNRPEVIPRMMEQFLAFVEKQPDREWFRGKLLVVDPHRIRIRN